MSERTTTVTTPDGAMRTFIATPPSPGASGRGEEPAVARVGDGAPDGSARHPVVLVYMDALGIREELRVMARRIAARGYYAMLPDLFYRAGGPSFDASTLPDYLDPRMEALNVETTMAMVASDTRALLEFAAGDEAASTIRVGAIGFCMGGRHAVTAAAENPELVRVAVSVHGGRLVSEAPDSAHLRLREIEGEVYFGFADGDPSAPREHLDLIREEIAGNRVSGCAELHPGALHGFVFPERFCYDETAAERCWARFFTMLERNGIAPGVGSPSPSTSPSVHGA